MVRPSRRSDPGDLRDSLSDRPAAVTTAPKIDAVLAAAARTRGFVRRTPLLMATPGGKQSELPRGLLLKLESLQVTGSFKARGAISAVFASPPQRLARGIVTASGGNHGLAVAYAGWAAGVPATIFLPNSVAAEKREKFAPGARASWSRARCGMTATGQLCTMPRPKLWPTSTRLPIPESSPVTGPSRSRYSRRRRISIR